MTDVTFSKREISVAPGRGHEPSFVAFVRAHLPHFHWAHFRSFSFCRSFPLLARAIGVGLFLSLLAVLSFSPSADEEETARSERPYRVARVRAPPSGLASFSKDAGEEVLDSDFVIEQAALTWSHRRDDGTDVTDGLGVMRFGPVKVHQSVVEHVVKAAKTTEMDPALLMAIADKGLISPYVRRREPQRPAVFSNLLKRLGCMQLKYLVVDMAVQKNPKL